MVAALLLVALSLPARSGMWPKAEERAPLFQAQALLQGKLDGDVKATLLEHGILSRSLFVGMWRLLDGTPSSDRTEVVRQRKADLGFGGGSKTLKDVDQEMTTLFYRTYEPLPLFSMAPEHRSTVPSAAECEESCRMWMEAMAPWEACRRAGGQVE